MDGPRFLVSALAITLVACGGGGSSDFDPSDGATAPLTSAAGAEAPTSAGRGECQQWQSRQPDWIWCDDFESGRSLAEKYGRANIGAAAHADSLERSSRYAADGGHALRFTYAAFDGSDASRDAGSLRRNFGRAPFADEPAYRGAPPHYADEDFDEIYYRYYLRHAPGFRGGWPDKSSRAFVLADGRDPWGPQAMVAHLWTIDQGATLGVDPVSGVDPDSGRLLTRRWNDMGQFRWLNKGRPPGSQLGRTPLNDQAWQCIEARVRLNRADPVAADGLQQFWIDGEPQLDNPPQRLNFTGAWRDYGINGIQLESYWNAGSPVVQDRYVDRFVISRSRIGCGAAPEATP